MMRQHHCVAAVAGKYIRGSASPSGDFSFPVKDFSLSTMCTRSDGVCQVSVSGAPVSNPPLCGSERSVGLPLCQGRVAQNERLSSCAKHNFVGVPDSVCPTCLLEERYEACPSCGHWNPKRPDDPWPCLWPRCEKHRYMSRSFGPKVCLPFLNLLQRVFTSVVQDGRVSLWRVTHGGKSYLSETYFPGFSVEVSAGSSEYMEYFSRYGSFAHRQVR